jgi:hypothetical protein
MEFIAFASFVALIVAWVALPVRTAPIEIEEKKAA